MVKCFFFKYFYGICIKGVIFKEICVLKFNEFVFGRRKINVVKVIFIDSILNFF